MKIRAVRHVLPSLRITNDRVIDRLRDGSAGTLSAAELDLLEARVRHFLEQAGTQVRYRLADHEHAADLVLEAGRAALATADLDASEVDLIIYAGVGRPWLEPAMANAIQVDLGLANATGFDVLDACTSWLRSLHIARTFFAAGTYRNALIVNCECASHIYGTWDFADLDELEHRLAMYTIGEAATATVVTNEGEHDDFHFAFANHGAHVDLCAVPLPAAEHFFAAPERRQAPLRFFSRSRALLAAGTRRVVEMYRADPTLRELRPDLIFGHEASLRATMLVGRQLGLSPERYFSTHATHGNTIAACIPLGMSLALDAGRLRRGTRTLILVAGAGVSVGACSFTY